MTSETQHAIQRFLNMIDPGAPISYSTLAKLGSKSSTQHALRQLCATEKLINVCRGFYVKPRHIKSLPQVALSCSPDSIAKLWALENGYILVSSGFEEMHRLRFQAQTPVKQLYWSNGPARVFRVGNATVTIKRVVESKLLWHDHPLGRLYRAMVSLNPKYTTRTQIEKALTIICSSDKQACVERLLSEKSLKKWRQHLLHLQD